jgi:hypothetical protein
MSDIVERLRADLASGLSASLGDTKEAADEIEKLREALQRIVENEDQFSMAWAAEIARAVLGEKE